MPEPALDHGHSGSRYQRDNTALRKENERFAAELAACREERNQLHTAALIFGSALRFIRGPASGDGPFMAAYQDAGGGYEGLQAVAQWALGAVDE